MAFPVISKTGHYWSESIDPAQPGQLICILMFRTYGLLQLPVPAPSYGTGLSHFI